MCNRYFQPPRDRVNFRHLFDVPVGYAGGDVFPRGIGAFIRPAAESGELELIQGQWALIPPFAKTRTLSFSTNNARIEGVATAASYKLAWLKGQRCLIPADIFWEPCWESGKNEWWRFRRADGQPWALAGLWNCWLDRKTGELVESYTMLTQNADAHPLMRRMHKPDPKVGPDQQDKRSIVAIEERDIEQWLNGTEEDARDLVRLTPVEVFEAGPEVRDEGSRQLF